MPLEPMDDSADEYKPVQLQNQDDRRSTFRKTATTSGPIRHRKKKDRDAPKHPLSAFLFYLKEVRPHYTKKYPGIRMAYLTREISKTWREMTPENKSKYDLLSMNDKCRYSREMDEWLKTKIKQQLAE